jgi:hypothetical protein
VNIHIRYAVRSKGGIWVGSKIYSFAEGTMHNVTDNPAMARIFSRKQDAMQVATVPGDQVVPITVEFP